MEGSSQTASPPKVPFALGLGVTGHRSDRLEGSIELVERRLDALLGEILAAARGIAADAAACFADQPARIFLVSPLAEGADQAIARIALEHGIELHAVLPFERTEYEKDFPESEDRDRLAALIDRADRLLELPGRRAAALQAYVMAGRATVSHCDLLIAVWDGKPSRGRGGTGEVVEIALLAGTPILHIPVAAEEPIALLWSGFDPHVRTHRQNSHTASRPYSPATLRAVLEALLDPPSDPAERAFLAEYYRERERRLNPRMEYPLLLALTGVARLRGADFRTKPFATALAEEWTDFRERCAGCTGVTTDIDPLQNAYCWSDLLARHFAQTYRSGHVFNFLLGAVAVLIALSGLLVPESKMVLALAELAVIGAVIANTRIGVSHGWHRRWLDYRNLAERLRPMRGLKLLGLAAPEQEASARHARWIEWYAARMWRAIGLPEGRIADPAALAGTLVAHELDPQIAYHRAAAIGAERLDHRLHMIGTALFIATIVSCIVLVVGYLAAPGWVYRHAAVFVTLSAGLPALGTAIFGIRVQGDFAGTSLRSHATAERLAAIASRVDGDVDLPRAADLFERGAQSMLADIGEWRLAHRQRDLVIP